MASVMKDFDTYSVHLYAEKAKSSEIAAEVTCFNAGQRVGFVHFFGDAATSLDNASSYSEQMGPVLAYSIDEFDAAMDILRYEQPLFLAYDTETKFGYIGTRTAQAVGQGHEQRIPGATKEVHVPPVGAR